MCRGFRLNRKGDFNMAFSFDGLTKKAKDIAALAAAVFRYQGNDFAGTKIDGRYRGFHRKSYPRSSGNPVTIINSITVQNLPFYQEQNTFPLCS